MEMKNFVGKVTTIKKSKLETPVEVLAETLEEAVAKIEKDMEENIRVVMKDRDYYDDGKRKETLISTDTTIDIKEAE